jgi:ribosomal protein L37AE/L43A
MHDVSTEQKLVFKLLREMTPMQRANVFVWFCHQCGEEIPPGGPYGTHDPHVCAKCDRENQEEDDGT